MNYYIQTWQNGVQLLGTDYSRIVRDCKTSRKLNNAIKQHKENLLRLHIVHPNLNEPYEVKSIAY